jgi:hypothetical protein
VEATKVKEEGEEGEEGEEEGEEGRWWGRRRRVVQERSVVGRSGIGVAQWWDVG